MLSLKGETVVAWPRTGLQQSIVAADLSRTEGVLGIGGCERHAAHRPPPTTGSWPSITTKS